MKPRRNRVGGTGSKGLPPTKEVVEIDKIDFEGNLVPHAWYHHIKTDRGLTDAIGCLILAEIVYWYRSASVKEGGKETRYRRFNGDMLQKGYKELEEKFGFTKRQLIDAMVRLEGLGLIKRHTPTIEVRGRRIPNVLFLQVFPDRVREISTLIETTGVSEPKGRDAPTGIDTKTSGTKDSIPGEAVSPPEGGDIYIEYPKDYDTEYPKDRVTNSTTSSSKKPDEPASGEEFILKEKEREPSEPGTTQAENPENENIDAHGHDCSATESPVMDDHDLAGIRRRLETAFGGQSLTPHSEQKLREYVADGRITRSFAEALALARSYFDHDRAGYKAKNFFIPVQPSYLFKSYDLTVKGILGVLGECYGILQAQEDSLSFDEEKWQAADCALRRYDSYFRKNGCLEPGYELSGGKFAPMRDGVLAIFANPMRYPGWEKGDVDPPAWMKILYAQRNQLYSFEEIQSTFLKKAQGEIRNDPRCLKLEGANLTDEQIKELFELDYSEELEKQQRKSVDLDRQMARWEHLMAAVEECQAAATAPLRPTGRSID